MGSPNAAAPSGPSAKSGPDASPARPQMVPSSRGGHRRSLSGSILARLPFLRSSVEDLSLAPLPQKPEEEPPPWPPRQDADASSSSSSSSSPPKPASSAAVVRQSKTRRRRGSLRKTAILGTRERRGSTMDAAAALPSAFHLGHGASHAPQLDGDSYFPRPLGGESEAASYARTLLVGGGGGGGGSSSSSAAAAADNEATPTKADFERHWRLAQAQSMTLDTDASAPDRSQPSSAASAASAHHHNHHLHHHHHHLFYHHHDEVPSPITSPTSGPYASTTDDDDGLTFSRRTNAGLALPLAPQPPAVPSSSLLRRRSTVKPTPLSALPATPLASAPSAAAAAAEWDYAETSWWGYFILLTTWLAFVVGMGSCLGVWSWAWDVGETPYAPPELEDDPTLPIVGYYPALIILTAVMAWAWCLVAWVGMKYFRHAKVVGDE